MTWKVEDMNRRLVRARDTMDRAYAEPLDIRAVAAVACLSEAHFIRCFRACFGETPSEYRLGHEPIDAPHCSQMAGTRLRSRRA